MNDEVITICMKFGIDILYVMPLIIVSFMKIGAVKAILCDLRCFGNFTQRRMVVPYRRFGTTYGYFLQW